MVKRIGIIGGTFDPPHIGHLIIAQDAVEQFELDHALFVPAWQAPLKAKQPSATPAHRMAMLRAAVRDDVRFSVSDVDFRDQSISYSVLTARRIREVHPQDQLFWVLGADQLAQLHLWRDLEELATLVDFIAFEREGAPSRNPELPSDVRVHWANRRAIDISSTEIRDRLKSGLSTKYFLPGPVFDYIKAENPYPTDTNHSNDKQEKGRINRPGTSSSVL